MKKLLMLPILGLTVACNSQNLEEQIAKTLESKPEIIIDSMKKNPVKYLKTLQEISASARQELAKEQALAQAKELEQYIANPIKMKLSKDDLVRGSQNPKIVIYEYSDFQCGYCAKAYTTIKSILGKHNDVAFVYKHLPIDSIHPNARLAAQYFEAVRIAYGEKAFNFHDILMQNQREIRFGKKYLNKVVKEMGLDLKKVEKLANSKEVSEKIKRDEKEAQKFGFSGTPGFMVGGVPVKGAYPLDHFELIISKLKEKI